MTRGSIGVGLSVSLTGQFSSQGRRVLEGLRYWVDDCNTAGGLRLNQSSVPLPVRLLHYDDESRLARAAGIARRLIDEDRVDILFGPYSSSLTLASARVCEEKGVALWNHGGASDAVQFGGFTRVVSILAPASSYLSRVVDFLANRHPRSRKAAVLRSSQGTFPKAVGDGFVERARQANWEVVFDESYEPDCPGFRRAVKRLGECSPDVVVGVGRIQDDLALAKELATASMDAEAMVVVAAGVSQFGKEMGAFAEGFIGPSQWEPGLANVPDHGPTTAELRERHAGFQEGEADYTMAQAYAAGLVVERCVMEAGSLDGTDLVEAAKRLRFTTFYGSFEIDPANGAQVGKMVPLVQWNGGRKRVVWPNA